MCLGHVLLEEHQPYGIGNHAVIITEPNDELYARFKGLLESLHFTGFSNFDIKYDERDDTYKAFEINCRQGRSNYYVTGAGMNVARSVVSDRIEHEPYSFTTCQDETLWMVVPEKVAFDFTPTAYHERMRALVSAGKVSNPLRYPAETGLMHKLRVERNMLRHRSNFETYYHRFE
jgi:D-aspartate ligase